MDLVLLLARLLLAGVFLVAGIAKLADRRGSVEAMRDFGFPARLAAPAGIALPIAEIAVAVALIPTATTWWGALGVLVLLLAFVGAIAFNLARGNQPDCHCFGQLHSEPAGWPTLVRNGILSAIAAFVLFAGWNDPGASAVAWITDLSAVEGVMLLGGFVLLTLVAAEGWVLLHLLQQNGRLLLRLDVLEAVHAGEPRDMVAGPSVSGLPTGTQAPKFSLSGLYGETMTLDALRAAGKPVLLLFADPNCGPCNALLPDVGRWQREHAAALTVAVVTRGTQEANRSKSTQHGVTLILLQEDREVAEIYGATGTPAAVLVKPDGNIGHPLALGADAIRSLVADTAGSETPKVVIPLRQVPINRSAKNGSRVGQARPAAPVPARVGPQVGESAPALRLPDLDGTEVELTSFTGTSTLVLFWNPGCGFCRRMLDDLKTWEATWAEDEPQLVVVSSGSVGASREAGLSSPVLIDAGFAAGRAFGVSGTPSAVLVDAEGNIASPVAVGAPAVMELARGGQHEVRSETA